MTGRRIVVLTLTIHHVVRHFPLILERTPEPQSCFLLDIVKL